MTDLFLTVLKLSASGSILAGVVLVSRLLLKKAPKWLHVALWAMVAVRLMLPVSIESRFSRMPEAVASGAYVEQWQEPEPSEAAAMPVHPGSALVVDLDLEEEQKSPLPLISWLWFAGVIAMGIYTAGSYLRLKRRVSTAVRLRGNVYLSEKIPSPFVLGVIRPKIYLPSRLDGSALNYVLAHERSHIRRGDHLWKPLGFTLLSIHWFNPVLWLCYILLCRDIELACDEKVVKTLNESDRADYSQALLDCAVSHRSIAACPIAFGEVGVKRRVKNVLSYKKPGFWILLVSLLLCIAIALGFLTDPLRDTVLLDQVIAQDGYYITKQESKTINLVIEKDSIVEESFTPEGCSYSPGVIVPYHTMADNLLYLKHVHLDGQWLEFIFDFADSSYQHGQLLLPWAINLATGNPTLPATESNALDVWDNQNTYKAAATLNRAGNGRMFSVKVDYSIYQQANHHIAFALEDFNLLHYEKGQRRDYINEDPLDWLQNLSPQDVLYLEFRDPSATKDRQYTRYAGNSLAEAIAVLNQFDSKLALVPEPVETVGGGYEISVVDAYGMIHTIWNEGNKLLYIDGTYYEDSYDILNSSWDFFFAGTQPLPETNDAWGLSAALSDITQTGMTVSYSHKTTKPVGSITTDYRYRLQSQVDGQWQDLDSGGKGIQCSISSGYIENNLDTSQLNWSECYGPLPEGIYRMAVDFYQYSRELPTVFRTLYAEFYIGDESVSDSLSLHIFPTEVTPVGMTVLNLPDGAWQSMDAVTELNYYLEQEVNGQWIQLEPHSEEGLPIHDRTIHTIIDADTDRHILNWSTLYGTLPSGTYRLGIDYYLRGSGTAKTLYANFTIDDSMNPATFLSTMTAEARRCTAEFPPNIEEEYVFNKSQDAHLISLLNTLKPEEFFVGAAVDPKIVVTISHQASPVWLYWDGKMVQFSFVFDDTRWAVRNDELNAFLETLLPYSPANSTYEITNAAPLNELSDTYTQEEAIADGVVVLSEGDVRANKDIWEAFLLSTNSRIPANVRILKSYSATDSQKAVKKLYDLEFDGNSYYLHYVQNGTVKSVHYHNLCRRSAENVPMNTDLKESYAFYFLTNADTINPTQKVRENDRFAVPGDDPFMVWCDTSIRQNALPMPEDVSKITLEIDLQPYVTVTDPAILNAISLLFRDTEVCATPKTYFLGPVLRFHSPDGVDLTLHLDLEQALCTFRGQFYSYGSPGSSRLQTLWSLLDLTYWPEEVVAHPSLAYYFGTDPVPPSPASSG